MSRVTDHVVFFTLQEGAFALAFKSVHYPGEVVVTRLETQDRIVNFKNVSYS